MDKPHCAFPSAVVLVAEDTPFTIEILKQMLALFQVEVDIAVDGEEVIEKVQQKEYDLLILDIHMPKKDGNAAAREIRKMPIKQPILVALTASVFDHEKEESMQAGFDDYFNKPIALSGIERILTKYLSEKMVKN